MPKDWKVLQEIYHRTTEEYTDDTSNFDIQYRPDTVVEDCIRYIGTEDLIWFYPAKSYIVAICYAQWISEDFGGDFYVALEDPDLLFGNDPYFTVYSNNTIMYDKIIKLLGVPHIPLVGVIPDIREYYEEEFLMGKLEP